MSQITEPKPEKFANLKKYYFEHNEFYLYNCPTMLCKDLGINDFHPAKDKEGTIIWICASCGNVKVI